MDAFIVAAGRLPLVPCSRPPAPEKGFGWQKGPYHDLAPIELAAHCAKGVVARLPNFNPNFLENIIWGCANPVKSQNGNLGRLIAIHNGWRVPGCTVNQLCMSSVLAQHIAVAYLTSPFFGSNNQPRVFLVGGVEKMGEVPLAGIFNDMTYGSLEKLPPRACGMGLTAETTAQRHQISRLDLDEWAVLEHQRARQAIREGWFDAELIPVDFGGVDVKRDAMPPDLTLEMAQRDGRCYFDAKGVITQFGSSQMTDGAAALVFCNQAALTKYDWQPLARFIGGATGEIEPEIMGEGVIVAAEKFFAHSGMNADHFEVYEVNTAFGPVPLAYAKRFNVSFDRLNINGGATALGHPLGATGARLTVTGIYIARRLGLNRVLVDMCVGLGQGGLAAYEVY